MKRYTLFTHCRFLALALAIGIGTVLASPEPAPAPQASDLHPNFALLDADGVNVLESGGAVSTMQTCGQCHDTNFIQSHAFHSDLGLSDYMEAKDLNASSGLFGEWDPLTYRYLSQNGDELLDLSTAEWLMLNGNRVVGGGPATTSRDGAALDNLKDVVENPETAILDKDGNVTVWDWDKSGTMEMNCFLCHLEAPNTAAREEAIKAGDFGNCQHRHPARPERRRQNGRSRLGMESRSLQRTRRSQERMLAIQDPTNENCATCHGEVHPSAGEPITINQCDLDYPQTATTGQVVSGQRIDQSGVNLANKSELDCAWDVHAQRQLQCTDCHYALNNPSHISEIQKSNPEHLVYDPRSLEIGEYLQRPDHNFARGQSAQFNVAPEYKATMRRCENCHDASKSHADWLPYIDTHMEVVACETCHIPQMYAPAIQTNDWTVVTAKGTASTECRGVEGTPNQVTSLVTGYQPVLLNRTNIDGETLLAPYNLITSFYWVYDDASGNKRPVRLVDLEAAYLDGDSYAADIVCRLRRGQGRQGQSAELVIDLPAKEELVNGKLSALGLNNPRIEGLVQPYSINHNVVKGENALNDCKACHNEESRMTQPIKLADHAPVTPVFDAANNVNGTGELVTGEDGALYYKPVPANDKIYVFGSSRVSWIDWFGALAFAGALLGVLGHGTLRYLAARKQPKGHSQPSAFTCTNSIAASGTGSKPHPSSSCC